MAENLKEEYNVPVLPISIEAMTEKDMYNILREALYEFPVLEVKVNMPEWIAILNPDHPVKKSYIESIKESIIEIDKLKDIENITNHFIENWIYWKAYLSDVDPSTGIITVNLTAKKELYQQVLTEIIKIDVRNKADLLSLFQEFNTAKREYDK